MIGIPGQEGRPQKVVAEPVVVPGPSF